MFRRRCLWRGDLDASVFRDDVVCGLPRSRELSEAEDPRARRPCDPGDEHDPPAMRAKPRRHVAIVDEGTHVVKCQYDTAPLFWAAIIGEPSRRIAEALGGLPPPSGVDLGSSHVDARDRGQGSRHRKCTSSLMYPAETYGRIAGVSFQFASCKCAGTLAFRRAKSSFFISSEHYLCDFIDNYHLQPMSGEARPHTRLLPRENEKLLYICV